MTIHTSMGDITVQLFPDETPKTCENFVTHSRDGYYNNVVFHRIIKDFMIQTGDRQNGDGSFTHAVLVPIQSPPCASTMPLYWLLTLSFLLGVSRSSSLFRYGWYLDLESRVRG
jgi:hypothetical protein